MKQANNLILITFDSCRFDSFAAAATPQLDRLGSTARRYSFASWTVPSHVVLLMGISQHESPAHVYASEVYRKDFLRWGDRLNIPDIAFKDFLPQLSLANFLKRVGYKTNAMVSMPVLNQSTIINTHFDQYALMPKHNDFSAMLDKLEFSKDFPSFYLMNVGETHYPYTLPGETANDLPFISGVHGVVKHLDDIIKNEGSAEERAAFLSEDTLAGLKLKQISNVSYLDTLIGKMYDLCPPNTYIIVTSDHGECFGEAGYFGHGPVFHEKAFEVFHVEGKRP